MRSVDSQIFSNISATTATFQLSGGLYGIDYLATWGGGSVTLEKLGPDGSTYLPAAVAATANGSIAVYLTACTYKFVIATASAVYLSIQRIPGE